MLGDLYADKGDRYPARSHYDDAVRVAHNITRE
jgi:predicted negative regulator of RcsB-dependent stress response